MNARNVKIITANGRVTLRGPVNDETEKQAIADIASRIAQGGNVDNQIEVKREPWNKEETLCKRNSIEPQPRK